MLENQRDRCINAEGKEKEGEPGGACGCSSVPMANRWLKHTSL